MVAFTDLSGTYALPAAHRESAYDATLVQRFNTGDESAFAEIVARHHEPMVSIAFSLLHNRADAEEIAHETFTRARRSLAKFRSESSLSAWLHRLSLSLARQRYWLGLRNRHDLAHMLDQALGNRERLSRRILLNCSYREIARTFGISVRTAKRRIARAREHLRIQLAQACPDYSPHSSPVEWFDAPRLSGHREPISA